MVVTHLFQVLGIIAMEQPTSLTAKPLRDEINKVFESLRPLDPVTVLRGQYEGYLEEQGVAPDSTTETFVALRAWVDNARWMGVPFYLRTGKCLAQSRQMITIGLREPVMEIFPDQKDGHPRDANKLIIDFKDPGSIHAHFLAKSPDPRWPSAERRMHFHYRDSFQEANNLEAYERLLLEVMLGNQALFTRSRRHRAALGGRRARARAPSPIETYAKGSWGPRRVDRGRRPAPLDPAQVSAIRSSSPTSTAPSSPRTRSSPTARSTPCSACATRGSDFAVTSSRPPRGLPCSSGPSTSRRPRRPSTAGSSSIANLATCAS